MFISQEHQPQLLARDSYYSQEQYDRELSQLFMPTWHCIGVMSELPHESDYMVRELFGRSVVIWRKDDDLHAFLNVCAHRYAQLTSKSCGHADRLKCEYHGWQYDKTGNVCHIPDAKTFRPLERGMLGLTPYHVDRCGELIFISLAENPVTLRQFLGKSFDEYEQLFTPEMHTAIVFERTIDANWKVCVENALENYHTSEVHPRTFGRSPAEEDCTHELEENWTSMTISYEREKSFRNKLDAFGNWLVGKRPTRLYQHVVHYPHVMITHMSLYSWFESLFPLSPTRTLSIIRVLCHIGPSGAWRRIWNRFLIGRWPKDFLMKVGAEDAVILPHIQRGLQSADEPKGGLISTREERIFHFQNYIQQKTQPTYLAKQA